MTNVISTKGMAKKVQESTFVAYENCFKVFTWSG